MKHKNKPTDNVLSELGFTIFDGNKKVYNLYEGNSLMILYTDLFQKECFDEVRLVKRDNPRCSKCNCSMVKNGSTKFHFNKDVWVRIEGYKCSNEEETHYEYASKLLDVDKCCSFSREIRNLSVKLSLIDFISYEKIGEILEALTGIRLNRETIYYFTEANVDDVIDEIKEQQELEIKKLDIKPSGHFGYDEQYLFINGILFLRMTIIDNNTNPIIGEDIVSHEDFDKNTIQDFLEKSLKDTEVISITTDGNNAYPNIIEALGAIHNRYVFHVMKNLMDDIKTNIRVLKNRIDYLDRKIEENEEEILVLKQEVEGKIGRASKDDEDWNKNIKNRKGLRSKTTKLRNERTQKKKQLQYYILFKDRISLIFKSKSVKTANNRFNRIIKDKRLPDKIKTFLQRIEKYLPSILNHINHEEIPSTNNKVEGYYKITLPGSKKRIYRTTKGVLRRIKLSQLRRTHSHVLQHHGPILKINILSI